MKCNVYVLSRSVTTAAILLLAPAVRADDRTYADELKAAGHSVRLDKSGNLVALTLNKSELLTDAAYERLGRLARITHLTFYGTCKMTDANAEHVGRLTTLEELAINGTALSDDGFKHLGKLVNLRKLTFWHLGWQKVAITGKGFAELSNCPKLESFGFAGSTVGDEGLKALKRVKQLKQLVCYHTRVTDAGLAYLKELPELQLVNVGPQFSMRLGDAGLAILATVPTLESITFDETILTRDGSLMHLKNLKGLKELKLNKTEISTADLEWLKADLPGVKIEHAAPEPKELEQMRKTLEKK